jgi:hypothetical protein
VVETFGTPTIDLQFSMMVMYRELVPGKSTSIDGRMRVQDNESRIFHVVIGNVMKIYSQLLNASRQ